MLRLSVAAPAFATAYGINVIGGLVGQDYTIAGVGGRGSSGLAGATFGTGRLR